MSKKLPKIGLTMDWYFGAEKQFSRYPWYALRHNYAQSIADAGGMPILLPLLPELGVDYAAELDGLVLSGSDFDVNPELYGDTKRFDNTTPRPGKSQFETELFLNLHQTRKPIFGICWGTQLMNVACGGTLYQNILSEKPEALQHYQKFPYDRCDHPINITPKTKLAEITGENRMTVNSLHNQGINTVGRNLIVSATSPDGIVEAIEDPRHPFCIGVQWHPEFRIHSAENKLFQAFIQAA